MEFDYEDITHKEEQEQEEEEELCLDDYNTNQQINIEVRQSKSLTFIIQTTKITVTLIGILEH